ncbi:MAG: hypothetical protein KDH20_00375 [Rhodocyclaceae bacterium]|nr:hypothetical protein [Rhodocyclaceae bacterium]
MNDAHHRRPLHDIGDLDPDGLPSGGSLWRATGVAVTIAIAVLVLAILPAEYGIDPTGLGGRLGLTRLHAVDAPAPDPASTAPVATVQAAPSEDAPVARADTPYRSQALNLPLLPGQGFEIKALMKTGQRIVFDWVAEGGPVHVDMHGNVVGAAEDDFTSFWIADALDHASGAFRAPFDGAHGWYWQNNGEAPVTIRLKISGFYDEVYMP